MPIHNNTRLIPNKLFFRSKPLRPAKTIAEFKAVVEQIQGIQQRYFRTILIDKKQKLLLSNKTEELKQLDKDIEVLVLNRNTIQNALNYLKKHDPKALTSDYTKICKNLQQWISRQLNYIDRVEQYNKDY